MSEDYDNFVCRICGKEKPMKECADKRNRECEDCFVDDFDWDNDEERATDREIDYDSYKETA